MSETVISRDEILAMEPGREMDTMVVQQVFGKETKPGWYLEEATRLRTEQTWIRIPRYSTDISAAWEVVEKAGSYKLSKLTDGDSRIKYGGQYQCFIDTNKNCGYGKSAPEAICKAVLLAVME